MATPDPSNVAPWYLRNINQALALDETSGNVYVRTGFTGNIVIEGNVNIPGNVDAHVVELGNIDISGNTMPVSGNIIIESGNVTVLQGTDPWVVSGNVTIDNPATDLTIADSTYEMNVARGLITGQYAVLRSGYNPDCAQGVLESIWVEGGIYPFTSWTVAGKLYVISTSASDTGQQIYIEGLDASYNRINETITTNGTTAVATTQNFIRIWTATIITADTPNVGEITFRLTSGVGTVVAHIGAGLSITKLSQFTVPAGYTAYVQYGDATTFRSGSGNIGSRLQMMVRPFGKTFVAAFMSEVVNGYYRNDFSVPMVLTEKSDIDVQILADGNNTQATCNWQIILIPNA